MCVHSTHCCKDHGCKYSEEDCPVVSGKVLQEYHCESCSSVEVLPEGVDYTLPDNRDLKKELKKELLKLSIKDGLVDLYEVLEVVDQVFSKDSKDA